MQRLATWQLFALCVLVWGTTWHVITYQLGAFPAELGVALRYAIAGSCVLALARWRGERLRHDARAHALFALQGTFLYGLAYVTVYHAERHVPSGLVAVGYAASPLVTGIGAAIVFGAPLARRFVLGGALGLAGVALIFAPELARPTAGAQTILGAWLTVVAVSCSAIGSLAASLNRQRGHALFPAMGYGMLYGAFAATLVGVALGAASVPGLAWPAAASWWIALTYLALAGSVLAFACFLTLQDRVGPGAAGTVGVMTPLIALVVSTLFEAFRPDLRTAAGALLAVAGNALMLRPASPRPAVPVALAAATE